MGLSVGFSTIFCTKVLLPPLIAQHSIIINTFVPKIHLFSRTKKSSFFFFKSLQVSIHNQEQKFYGDVSLQTTRKIPGYNDNVEKLCESPEIFRMDKGCPFGIINTQEMHFCSCKFLRV